MTQRNQGLFILRQKTTRQSTALEICNRTPMRLLDSPGHFRLEKLTSSKKGGSPPSSSLGIRKVAFGTKPHLFAEFSSPCWGALPLYGLLVSSITVILGKWRPVLIGFETRPKWTIFAKTIRLWTDLGKTILEVHRG